VLAKRVTWRDVELADKQWERLKPVFAPQKHRTGRPAHEHRMIVDDILWVLLRPVGVNDL
jgi:transposase